MTMSRLNLYPFIRIRFISLKRDKILLELVSDHILRFSSLTNIQAQSKCQINNFSSVFHSDSDLSENIILHQAFTMYSAHWRLRVQPASCKTVIRMGTPTVPLPLILIVHVKANRKKRETITLQQL